MTRRTNVLVLLLVLALAVPALMGAAEPSADQPPQLTVLLKGPFGAVAGTDPGEPATAAPDGRPLSTWMREATLELVTDPQLERTAEVTVSATASESGETVALPLEDGRWVIAPDQAGRHTVVATIGQEGRGSSQHAWLLDVPDRPGSWETMLERPALEASVTASSGVVSGVRGHGCYVDMCQEVGYRPPAESMDALMVAVGEPIALELDDSSAIVHWEGRLEPQRGTASETRLAQASFDEPVAGPTLTGLEPDRPGEWLLELRADYDRERGWGWYLFRLVAE